MHKNRRHAAQPKHLHIRTVEPLARKRLSELRRRIQETDSKAINFWSPKDKPELHLK